eukprot:5589874-Prorocentrum_lima.AAC.1
MAYLDLAAEHLQQHYSPCLGRHPVLWQRAPAQRAMWLLGGPQVPTLGPPKTPKTSAWRDLGKRSRAAPGPATLERKSAADYM